MRTLELCRLSVCRHKNSFVCCVALGTLSVCGHRNSFVCGVALLSSWPGRLSMTYGFDSASNLTGWGHIQKSMIEWNVSLKIL